MFTWIVSTPSIDINWKIAANNIEVRIYTKPVMLCITADLGRVLPVVNINLQMKWKF